jgi:hypothetical protein
MDEVIPFSFIFSYWIVLWFIVYLLFSGGGGKGDGKRYIPNPVFAFFIGILENLFTLFMILLYRPDFFIFMEFLSIMICIKIIPFLYLLYRPIHLIMDIKFFVILFILYNIYLFLCNTNLYTIYKTIISSILNNDNRTPMFSVIHQNIQNLFGNLVWIL